MFKRKQYAFMYKDKNSRMRIDNFDVMVLNIERRAKWKLLHAVGRETMRQIHMANKLNSWAKSNGRETI